MKTNNKTLFVKCSCGSEFLCIEAEDNEDMYYVSIWTHGQYINNKLTLKDRLRFAWQILIHGRPYGDQLIMHTRDFENINNFINETKNTIHIKET